MKAPSTVVTVLLLWSASPAGAQPQPSDAFDAAFASAQERARKSFLSHQPGQSYVDDDARLPPVPSDAAKAARRSEFASALRDVRSVQEGCELPCALGPDAELYIAKVKLASAALKIPPEAAASAVEHYVPKGAPRKRSRPGGASPNALDARALAAQLSRTDLPPDARRAFTARAAAMAAALDQRKSAENVSGGSAVAAGRTLSAEERSRLLDAYRSARGGDSTVSLRIVSPPSPQERRRTQNPDDELTSMQKFALWVDDKVGSKNIETASNLAAGFGDGLTLNVTHWVRGKMGTNGMVDDGSTAYIGGGLASVAVSLMLAGGGILKPFSSGVQQVARWAPTIVEDGSMVLKEGQFVMAGEGKGIAGAINWLKAGGPELAWKAGPKYLTSAVTEVPGRLLRYPIAEEGRIMGVVKGLMGQRIYIGPTVPL